MKNILKILGWKKVPKQPFQPSQRTPEELAKAKAAAQTLINQLHDARK